jgi:hypothetical protein
VPAGAAVQQCCPAALVGRTAGWLDASVHKRKRVTYRLIQACHVQGQHIYKGRTYTRPAHIQGQHIYKGSTYTRAAHIQGRHIYKGSTYTRAAHIQGQHMYKGSTYTRAAHIQGQHSAGSLATGPGRCHGRCHLRHRPWEMPGASGHANTPCATRPNQVRARWRICSQTNRLAAGSQQWRPRRRGSMQPADATARSWPAVSCCASLVCSDGRRRGGRRHRKHVLRRVQRRTASARALSASQGPFA